jgi:hypothetical protein
MKFPPFFSKEGYDPRKRFANTGRQPKVASSAMGRISLANMSARFFCAWRVGESVWIALANTSA